MTFTRHEEEEAFTVDAILRNFPPVRPFVVQWEFPLMRPNDDLDPSDLKQAQAGRKPKFKTIELLEFIKENTINNPISVNAWATAGNISRQTLQGYLPEMRRKGWILTVGEGNNARQYISDNGLLAIAQKGAGNE